jgi:hypothetical protein
MKEGNGKISTLKKAEKIQEAEERIEKSHR